MNRRAALAAVALCAAWLSGCATPNNAVRGPDARPAPRRTAQDAEAEGRLLEDCHRRAAEPDDAAMFSACLAAAVDPRCGADVATEAAWLAFTRADAMGDRDRRVAAAQALLDGARRDWPPDAPLPAPLALRLSRARGTLLGRRLADDPAAAATPRDAVPVDRAEDVDTALADVPCPGGPGVRLAHELCAGPEGRWLERVEVTCPQTGATRDVWFDVSGFWGR
jgi:hypothetical protein